MHWSFRSIDEKMRNGESKFTTMHGKKHTWIIPTSIYKPMNHKLLNLILLPTAVPEQLTRTVTGKRKCIADEEPKLQRRSWKSPTILCFQFKSCSGKHGKCLKLKQQNLQRPGRIPLQLAMNSVNLPNWNGSRKCEGATDLGICRWGIDCNPEKWYSDCNESRPHKYDGWRPSSPPHKTFSKWVEMRQDPEAEEHPT